MCLVVVVVFVFVGVVVADFVVFRVVFFVLCFLLQRTSKRVKVIRSIIREVCGLNPFEKRMIDVLKVGAGANPEKKIYKIAKKKVCLFVCLFACLYQLLCLVEKFVVCAARVLVNNVLYSRLFVRDGWV